MPDSVDRMYPVPAFPGRAGGEHFAVRIEQAAAADGREDERQLELRAQDRRLQIDRRNRDRAARAKRQLFVGLDVVAQRHFRIGAAVDVIEDHARQALFRQPPEVADVEDVRRSHAARHRGILIHCTLHGRTSSIRVAGAP